MPLYDFKCPECEHILEIYMTMEEAKQPVYCPNCGAKMERYYGDQYIWNEVTEERNEYGSNK